MIAPSRCTLSDLFESRYRPQRLLGKKPATVALYRESIRLLERYAARPLFVDDLTDELLADFAEHRLTVGGSRGTNAAPTVNKYLRHLRAVWNYAYRKRSKLGFDDLHEPDVACVPEKKPQPKAWTVEQVSQILRAAAQERGEIAAVPADAWWLALLLTVYDSGGRITAVMSARWSDLNVETRTLRLRAEHQKQGEDQLILLHVDTLRCLLRLWTHGKKPDEMLFRWDRDPQRNWVALRRHYKRILHRAELPTSRKDLFHKLRRTNATQTTLVAGRAAATEQLGHSSGALLKFYLDSEQMPAADAADRIARPLLPDLAPRQRLLFE